MFAYHCVPQLNYIFHQPERMEMTPEVLNWDHILVTQRWYFGHPKPRIIRYKTPESMFVRPSLFLTSITHTCIIDTRLIRTCILHTCIMPHLRIMCTSLVNTCIMQTFGIMDICNIHVRHRYIHHLCMHNDQVSWIYASYIHQGS